MLEFMRINIRPFAWGLLGAALMLVGLGAMVVAGISAGKWIMVFAAGMGIFYVGAFGLPEGCSKIRFPQ